MFSLGRETNTHVWLELAGSLQPRTICRLLKNILEHCCCLKHTTAQCARRSFVRSWCYCLLKYVELRIEEPPKEKVRYLIEASLLATMRTTCTCPTPFKGYILGTFHRSCIYVLDLNVLYPFMVVDCIWPGYKRVPPKKVHWGQFSSHHYRELRVILRPPPVLLLPNASSSTLDPPLFCSAFCPRPR